jgi:hypothetical protein
LLVRCTCLLPVPLLFESGSYFITTVPLEALRIGFLKEWLTLGVHHK